MNILCKGIWIFLLLDLIVPCYGVNNATCLIEYSISLSTCSVTCGSGVQNYTKTCCVKINTQNDCVTPPETFTGTITCTTPIINGSWSNWSSWSTCPVTCGGIGNNQNRTRTCTNPAPTCNGTDCSGSSTQYQTCNSVCCPVDGAWSVWGAWGTCTVTCGGGSQSAVRTCTNPSPSCSGATCPGISTTSTTCNSVCCPVNGGWSNWSSWSTCPVTCGGSGNNQNMTRTCTNPAPSCNGTDCSGSSTQYQTCNSVCCPVDGAWSVWGAWGTCTVTCGGGSQSAVRTCTNPSPSCSGAACPGISTTSTTCNSVCCPVNGGWSNWSSWSTCPVTCGGSGNNQNMTRTCTNPAPSCNGTDCSGSSTQYQTCNSVCCPVDGAWSVWGAWGTCTVTCGGGSQSAVRTCTNPSPSCSGATCPGLSTTSTTCNSVCCPVNGDWSNWSSWSTCPVTCGGSGNNQNMTRTCTNPAPACNGTDCSGSSTQYQTCNSVCCPVDGEWSVWGAWGTCTVTCGGGSQSSVRTCTNPAPSCNGATCPGISTTSTTCNSVCCPVNGAWSSWGSWEACPVTCGGASNNQIRTRSCTNPSTSCGGIDCTVSSGETNTSYATCNSQCCPVDGTWSYWSAWGTCTVTCGGGSQSSVRTCTNPSPSCNGTPCPGLSTTSTTCNSVCCPVDGAWSDWGSWEACPVTCGGTTNNQMRTRSCTNPATLCGGIDCTVSSGETNTSYTTCNTQCCPVDGAWSNWGAWDTCTVTCGGGSQSSIRTCTNPYPSCNGTTCSGISTTTTTCNSVCCPVDGAWSDWGSWEACPVTCGGATNNQIRTRSCTNPETSCGGIDCTVSSGENNTSYTTCNTQCCPVDGAWSDWGGWNTCTVTCGSGSQTSMRTCTNPSPGCNGTTCLGVSTTTITCDAGCCPVDGAWTDWGSWEACPVTCGGTKDNQIRTRSCTNPVTSCGGIDCTVSSGETNTSYATCNTQCCPVDGAWSDWGAWDTCTVTCGGGSQTSIRTCTNPSPSCNGTTCLGISTTSITCNTVCCPVDGAWSDWGSWESCPVTCDGTTNNQIRTRSCTNPSTSCGGIDCTISSGETNTSYTTCNTQCCPVDGAWSDWVAWGTCTVTCGGGSQSSIRTCTNPSPTCNGTACIGGTTTSTICNSMNCPVDGGWSDWGAWQTCPVTCAGTTNNQIRTRSCTNPTPSFGGVDCTISSGESNTSYATCNAQCCPVDGGWASWEEWYACPVTCGTGTQYRYRKCNNPAVSCGGAICPDCVGLYCNETIERDTDSNICNDFDCLNCGNRQIGYGAPSAYTTTTDTHTGFGILAETGFYSSSCCGLIQSWEFYASDAGELHLMVWRKSGSTYTLVGQNIYIVPNGAVGHVVKCTIREMERLTIRNRDMLGWYTPGTEIIPYSVSGLNNFRMTTLGTINEGGTFDWASTSFVQNRAYAIGVFTDYNTAPFFTNLDRQLTISDDGQVGGNIYKVQYYNGDTRDTLKWASTTSNSNISFDINTEMIYTKATLYIGNYTMTFSITDSCRNTASGTLTINVFNTPPQIISLPNFVTLSEDVKEGQLLYRLGVYDRQTTDTIKCSLTTVTPSTKYFSVHNIQQTPDYGVYLEPGVAFDYNTNKKYELLISCEDGKNAAVTGYFFVYIQKNHPPRFLNLPASIELDASYTLIGDLVYIVKMEDDEGDTLTFNLTTEPNNGPFLIKGNGDILTTDYMSNIFTPAFNLKVSVHDGRTTVGTRTLSVHITNINDVPVISNLPLLHPFLIEENSNVGTTLYHVIVRDLDTADTHLLYADFYSNTGSSYFHLSTDGFLTIYSQLDYESITNKSFKIVFTATDGKDTANATMFLSVTDENEAPVFHQTAYSVEQDESTRFTAFPSAGFKVYDPDVSESFTYLLDCGNDTWRFMMNNATGDIDFAYNYDLDKILTTQFNCVVRVKDKGFNTCTASLIVKIRDINDNSPYFNQTQFVFFITPYDKVGTFIGSVAAYDIDISDYGIFRYKLDMTSYSILYVQIYDNGTLYVNQPLSSRFQNGDVMTFNLFAIDYGGLQTTVKVWINFAEENTNSTSTKSTPKTFLLSSKNALWLTAVGILTICINLGTMYYCSKYWLHVDFLRTPDTLSQYKSAAIKVNKNNRKDIPSSYKRETPQLQNTNKLKSIDIQRQPGNPVFDRFRNSVAPAHHSLPLKRINPSFAFTIITTPAESENGDNDTCKTDQITIGSRDLYRKKDLASSIKTSTLSTDF